jgi:hypothetical protein
MTTTLNVVAGFAVGALLLIQAAELRAMAINVINDSGQSAYLTFGNGTPTGTFDGQPIQSAPGYPSLAVPNSGTMTLSGIDLRLFSGRLLFSLGSPLPTTPDFQQNGGTGWQIRWDKVEMTLDGTGSGVANLSSTDFFGLRLQVQNFKTGSSTPNQEIGWNTSATNVFSQLSPLYNNNPQAVASCPTGATTCTPGQALRVIAPSTVPPPALSSFPSMQPYIDYVQKNNISTGVTGQYTGRDTSKLPCTIANACVAQSYNFTATILANGDLQLTGTAGAISGTHTIRIAAGDLPLGILTTNPPFTVDGASDNIGDNDVYSTAVRDMISGFDYGFVGSTEINPNTGHPFATDSTSQWYVPPVGPARAFAAAQPQTSPCSVFAAGQTAGATCYNQYAGDIAMDGESYGFPFSDLLGRPFVSLDPSVIDRVDITIFADASRLGAPPSWPSLRRRH